MAKNSIGIMLVCIAAYGAASSIQAEKVIGWIEQAYLYPERFSLRAKIDTGARHTSINAEDLQISTRGTKEWARFTIKNSKGETLTIEKPVHRIAKIRRHSGTPQQRPAIFINICLGGVQKNVEVNLVNRAGFNYQLLVGRSFLENEFVVNPGSKDLLKNGCK